MRALNLILLLVVLAGLAFGSYWVLTDLRSPLPDAWNPLKELLVDDPVTPLTHFKLRRALGEPGRCERVLQQAAAFDRLTPLEDGDRCGIADRVDLRRVGVTALAAVEISCETALRLAMWERHGLQPAAQTHLGQSVKSVRHIGSYNCRAIRGTTTRMSTHATASAIDIGGVVLADGTRVELLQDWDAAGPKRDFLIALRDAGCVWFSTVLGPEFNRLHADHFHFQNRGWGTCR
ncbi:extensin-like protein [Litoreibacter ponti]|uniref:Extensin-like protein n=1 Tax=Litoreibacter ponti TaxID=1510457 RepID=A0A2T6BQ01_9RHOB|nr:extensin family protein [Litoreibacter ponti]PTX58116.1 extensin-like protein [Litoreibacter ponti]